MRRGCNRGNRPRKNVIDSIYGIHKNESKLKTKQVCCGCSLIKVSLVKGIGVRGEEVEVLQGG